MKGVGWGGVERRDTFFPPPLSASRKLAVAPRVAGALLESGGPNGGIEKKGSRNYKESDWVNKIRRVWERVGQDILGFLTSQLASQELTLPDPREPP